MLEYPIMLEEDDNDTLLVTSPDFPELTTFGDDREDAIARAVGCARRGDRGAHVRPGRDPAAILGRDLRDAARGNFGGSAAVPGDAGAALRLTLP